MITRVAERWGRSLDRQRRMFHSSALVESAHHPVNNVVVKDKHEILPCATKSETYSVQTLRASNRPVISSFPTVSIPEYHPDKPLILSSSFKQLNNPAKTNDDVTPQSDVSNSHNGSSPVNPCGIQMLSRSRLPLLILPIFF